jgi:capsid protein
METPPFKPTILDRAISAISPVAGMRRLAARQVLHQFSYDGARATTKRAQAPAQIAPNSFSVQRDRLQLLREATDLENNFAPAKTLNRKYAMYVAPQGYHAQTGDSQLDTDVEHYLNQIWFPNADVAGRADFFRLLEFGVIGMNRGGDYGWAYMRPGFEEGMSIDDAAQLPFAIQPVESDRIGGVYQNVVSEDYVSGIIIGEDGAKVGYRVFRRGMAAGQYMDPVDVPASQFVHYLDPMLVDMYRGVSKLDAACANLRDLYEMIDLTKGKAKLAAALTVFTNSIGATAGTGAMDGYASQVFDNQQSGLQQDILYGQINHLTAGSEIKFPSNESPGTSDQYLMTMLLKLVAMSYNLPFSFALDATALGGVSSRLESEQAKAEFERGQKVLAPHAHRIKNAALIDAIGKGYFPASVANKIGRGRWSYRPHPQPDIGKEANAAMNLYQNGLLNPMQYWTDDAQDPENVAKDMVRWAVIKRQAAQREGFTVEEVFGSGPAKPTNISQSETTTTDENGQPVAKAFKQTPAEAERAAVIRELVDLLKAKLPTDQAIAAAYKIYDAGKTRAQLVAEVKANLKDNSHSAERHFETWDESKHPRADDGQFGDGPGDSSKGKQEKASKAETKSTRPPPAKATPKCDERCQRAKAAHVMVDKSIQRYAEEHNEPKVAKALGGVSFPNGEPIDIAIPGPDGVVKHGVELKTMVANSNGKITMKGDAIARKKSWERKNKAQIHTIVIDDSQVMNAKGEGKHDESKRKIYYASGYGSFRIGSLHEVKGGWDEVKGLMNTPYKKLPTAAKKR